MHSFPIFVFPILLVAAPAVTAAHEKPVDEVAQRRRTAITLNYCRASFRRIQRCPSKRVLIEERDRILNNLNLNMVADEEVVRLYAAVLDQITEIKITRKEQSVIRGAHRRQFRHRLVGHVAAFSVQVASSQYVQALKTGARSWWDYRTMVWNRDIDLWQIEKKQLQSINDKSTFYLDTFWKLARKRNIPDKWLVRSDDLDRLDAALQEPDLRVRLRVLRRMEPFLQCYPPYWYYVGRTQQALGKLDAAATTFSRLETVGRGHFRKDELLAAAVANLAAIEESRKKSSASKTARRALAYATDVWEANLLCAGVLSRAGRHRESEEALLRNLDVNLEAEYSLSALLELYCNQKRSDDIEPRLSKDDTMRTVSPATLLRCLPVLKREATKRRIREHLAKTVTISVDRRFGADDVLVRASRQWKLDRARPKLSMGKQVATLSKTETKNDYTQVRFRNVVDAGSILHPVPVTVPLTLTLNYADGTELALHFRRNVAVSRATRDTRTADFATAVPAVDRLELVSISLNDARISFLTGEVSHFKSPRTNRVSAAKKRQKAVRNTRRRDDGPFANPQEYRPGQQKGANVGKIAPRVIKPVVKPENTQSKRNAPPDGTRFLPPPPRAK